MIDIKTLKTITDEILEMSDDQFEAILKEHETMALLGKAIRITAQENTSWDEAMERAVEYADSKLPTKYALVDCQDWNDYNMDQLEYLKNTFDLKEKI